MNLSPVGPVGGEVGSRSEPGEGDVRLRSNWFILELSREPIRRIRELTKEHAEDFIERWNEHIRRQEPEGDGR